MNRRGFLRGAISVMAVAATLKGRASTITEADVLKAAHDAYQSGGRPETLVVPGRVVDDLSDVIYRISPHGSPLCSTCSVGGKHGLHEWVEDELEAARPSSEAAAYRQVVGRTQIFSSEFGQLGHRAGRVRLLAANLRRRFAARRGSPLTI